LRPTPHANRTDRPGKQSKQRRKTIELPHAGKEPPLTASAAESVAESESKPGIKAKKTQAKGRQERQGKIIQNSVGQKVGQKFQTNKKGLDRIDLTP
tara:strand:- start:789 stop:1079 length:291 start_codon:yes stop_codon:yes gene_type:complete